MTSFEKAVKGACKPKPNPPKAKYVDPILAATWSDDGAVHDVCRALAPRFREPNAVIVFKALIVLHTMIRNGSTDNVLQYLSSSDVLKLKNISAGNWDGYQTPQNMQQYAVYLDSRIRAYRELKHDAIHVQSESNRDMRNSQAIEEERDKFEASSHRSRGKGAPTSGVQRSKTVAGRKLRVMTVEKGLLRETKIVQKMIDALVECRFYLDDLDNELNITALRMLVKDLLILFQACNEGVINVLEHYFEMFRSDAVEALKIYRHFCEETERVVEYLGVAKKLQNILNVPIPNLRHAPVSLAGALEEYLNDPNFEQNRIEYKTNKEAAERNEKLGVKVGPVQQQPDKAPSSKPSSTAGVSSSQPAPAKAPANQELIDFFSAIEEEQQTMFNPQTNSPSTTYFQQHAAHNPFTQPQMTGAPFGAQPFVQTQLQAQLTGFVVPQHTAFQMPQQATHTNPFNLQAPQQQPAQQFQPILQSQHTGLLQPQATGANPFRQSMMFQQTGVPSFGMDTVASQQPVSTNPFPVQNIGQPATGQQQSVPAPGHPSFNLFTSAAGPSTSAFPPQVAAPSAQPPSSASNNIGPARPASTPLTALSTPSTSATGPPAPQPIRTHQTGSRNPFGTPVTPAPPMPKPPTLMELAMGGGSTHSGSQFGQQQPQTAGAPTDSGFGVNGFGSNLGHQPTGSVMSNVASSFSYNKPPENQHQSSISPLSPQQTSTATGSTFSSTLFSSLASQPTGATATTAASAAPSISISSAAPLQPQKTGFSGIKAFKPSSSFGAALLESLPPIPQSAPSTPNEQSQPTFPSGQPNSSAPSTNPTFGSGFSGLSSQHTGFGLLNTQPTGALNAQPTGTSGGLGTSSLGVGLRPQATGAAGAANPFRASMFSVSPAATGVFGSGPGSSTLSGSSPSVPGLGHSLFGTNNSTGTPSFGSGQLAFGQDMSKQQQQQRNGSASLI
ncbi:hypothetical protein AcV5_002788 [Taiwanofungus camphoratus]|nr:hypothetical protein AcV5_002788 [Antrodia cinnamomea]